MPGCSGIQLKAASAYSSSVKIAGAAESESASEKILLSVSLLCRAIAPDTMVLAVGGSSFGVSGCRTAFSGEEQSMRSSSAGSGISSEAPAATGAALPVESAE